MEGETNEPILYVTKATDSDYLISGFRNHLMYMPVEQVPPIFGKLNAVCMSPIPSDLVNTCNFTAAAVLDK